MKVGEAFSKLATWHSDEIVVLGLGTSTQEWLRVVGPEKDESFHMHAMGLAASFGLGFAIARPENNIWVVDGDGSLALSFGSVLTLAGKQPANLTYILTSNRVYGTIAGPKLPNANATDYEGVFRAAGVGRVATVASLEDFDTAGDLLVGPGFSVIILEVERDSEQRSKPLAHFEGPEIKYRFARHLEQRYGIPVLGPLGY